MKKVIRAISNNPWVELGARWILALTFLYASYSKILEPGQFARIIYGYQLFPEVTINLLAIIVPWLELVAALSLLLGIFPRAGSLLISGMLVLYMTVLGINLTRGHEFDCGCFSASAHPGSPESLLVRDMVYLVTGLIVFFFRDARKWCLQTGELYTSANFS